jgi:three-Cys-motif partner protein
MASSGDFHEKPFDEGTLTKLHIFELYARSWLPVFLAREVTKYSSIHIYDFFAGPGTDSAGTPGSPLRLLKHIAEMRTLPGWESVTVHAHFSDSNKSKIAELRSRIKELDTDTTGIELDIQVLTFEQAFERSKPVLANSKAAKLLLIDQFGVGHVTPEIFNQLIKSPTCDFLFFISSSTLNRFKEHPAIKQKIKRPDDYYHVHRAATEYYRDFVPKGLTYYLAPFSIMKGANIYGIIFGSRHPRGMAKFLEVAWAEDQVNGEADFNIHRDNLAPGQALLFGTTKVGAFEDELERRLRAGKIADEGDVIDLCFGHGVKPQHAQEVLKRLKTEGVINLNFRVPQIDRISDPRKIQLVKKEH